MCKKPHENVCCEDVLRAIRSAYPENIVNHDILFDRDSYYDPICDKVRSALGRIQGAVVLYDRTPEGRPHWNESPDPDEDPPDRVEEASSYDLVFLALEGEQFQFQGELDEDDVPEGAQEPVMVTVPTVGHIGCAVGISLIAPFAAVSYTEIEFAESGSGTLPDIWPCIFDLDGKELDLDAHYEGLFLESGINALRNLRKEIARRLDKFGVRVLSEQEIRAQVPGLKPDPSREFDAKKKVATVRDALFFQTFD